MMEKNDSAELRVFDVAVIGAGIVGCAAAELLSHYDISCCLIERSTDAADGTTKANSGIVHAGYDAKPGTKKAKLNVRGAALMEDLCRRLSVGYARCGSFVLSFDEEQRLMLEELRRRGEENGVQGLEILSREDVMAMEPGVSGEITGALYAPSAAIVDPMGLAAALAESAALNGVEILYGFEVTSIERDSDLFVIRAGDREIRARYLVNAAGVHADKVHTIAGGSGFSIRPVRGEYFIMDKAEGTRVNRVIFQCPTSAGKGVLVAPTVHGNLIVGPNAEDIEDPDDTATTLAGQQLVREAAIKSVPDIDFSLSIRNFAGVRAGSDTADFVIELSPDVPHFVNLAGVCSPGLTAAPAIAEECVKLLEKAGLELPEKDDFKERQPVPRIRDLPDEEKNCLIAQNPAYGHVICRCETVTEGEIVDVLHRPSVPATADGIKKRLGAGMGRCQGGFCMPRILEIISRERGMKPEDVLLSGNGSKILAVREEDTGSGGA